MTGYKNLCVSGTDVTFKLDSDAQGNVLPVSTYHLIEHAAVLRPTKVLLSGFVKGMTVSPMGVVTLPVVSPISSDMREEEFFVTAEAELPLPGRCASEAMGLI